MSYYRVSVPVQCSVDFLVSDSIVRHLAVFIYVAVGLNAGSSTIMMIMIIE